MTRPLYKPASSQRITRAARGHAGLWFNKFCDTWVSGRDSWSMSSKGSGSDNPKMKWIETLTKVKIGHAAQIEECVTRMISLVEGLGGIWMTLTTESRFVTGLGRSHSVENGFAWHPTLGVPYLPGSSIKGMIRAWAEAEAGQSSDKAIAGSLLGAPDKVGTVRLMDAIPIEPVQLEADVITPHYAGWSKEDPPGDWRSPTPIPFLVTAAQTTFLFAIAPRDSVSAPDLKRVEDWLREALEWAGAGAKTAVGYGRFVRDDEKSDKLSQLVRERAEQTRLEREAKKREEQRRSLSPVERDILDFLDSRKDRGTPKTTAIHNAIRDGRWTGDTKVEAAQWLEAKMIAAGLWKPVTNAKNPEKNRKHQRTLRVMGWLKGE